MAKAKVGLYLRYRQEGKQSPYRPVCWDAKNRLRPFWCMVCGVEEHHPEGSYHLRYGLNGKQVWEPVGVADPIVLRNSRIHDLSSPATTRKYLAAQDHNSPRRREQINAAAALVHKDENENKPTVQ